MDDKIVKLLDGTSTLSYHRGSEDWTYWKFDKGEITANSDLYEFLEKNEDVTVESLLIKEYPELSKFVDYDVTLAKIKDSVILVHDYTRIVLRNLCAHLLKEDIDRFIMNVYQNEDLKTVGLLDNKRFSYPTELQSKVEEALFTGLKYPLALKRLMRMIPHILWCKQDRYFLGLKPLQRASEYAETAFEYSKLEL